MLKTYRYETIAGELRLEIQRGELTGASRLPSERKLMDRFGVQRDTIRRALSLLSAEGAIVISDRRGAFVAPPPTPAVAAGNILLIAPDNASSTALESLIRGFSQAFAATPLTVLYFDSRPRHGQIHFEMPTDDYLVANDVAGVAIWPEIPADTAALRRLRDRVPLVIIDRHVAGFEADSAGFDNVDGGRIVTEHLLQRGHTRIGFLANDVFAEPVQLRWRGYALALEEAGIPVDYSCVALFHALNQPACWPIVRLMLAGAGDPVTAVACSNDNVARHLLHFLRREGRRVPEDIAVTGYGDLLPHSTEALRLTTVAQPFDELGRAAAKLLLARITHSRGTDKGAGADSGPQQIELPARLIVRESSGGKLSNK